MSEIYLTQSESETENIAFNLAENKKINFGDIIALRGDLGAGKTAFTRGFVRFFSPDLSVTSPTFSLVNEYNLNNNNKKILHFDMYRINSEDDLLSVGFYDYLEDLSDKIIIIEWFEKISGFFDENTLNIDIVKSQLDDSVALSDENERKIIFERL